MEKIPLSAVALAATAMILYIITNHRPLQQTTPIYSTLSGHLPRQLTRQKSSGHPHFHKPPRSYIREQYTINYHLPQLLETHLLPVSPIPYPRTSAKPVDMVISLPIRSPRILQYHAVLLPH